MTAAEAIDALLLLGGGGLLVEAVRALVNRRKMSADVTGELTRSAVAMLQPLRARVESLEAEAEHLRVDLHEARGEADDLRSEVKSARAEADRLRAEVHEARAELAELRGAPRPPHLYRRADRDDDQP